MMGPMGSPPGSPDRTWHALGEHRRTAHGEVFTIDLPGPTGPATPDPVVVLHGFPTSSADWRHVLDALGRGQRRVVLFDFLGFGLSDKPDIRYGIDLHADTTVELLDMLGIRRCVLVSHDMGDTVGGELLARTMPIGSIPADPAWAAPAGTAPPTSGRGGPPPPLELNVTGRVVVNGSIYLELAALTPGQQRLWALPDERLDERLGAFIGGESLAEGLAGVCHPDHRPGEDELAAMVAAIEHHDGHLLLPRLIRYLDDRRRAEERYTGAIEQHPGPLQILWAQQDPVAVAAMGERLARRAPGAVLHRLDGFAHYPMVEDPGRFGTVLAAALGNS